MPWVKLGGAERQAPPRSNAFGPMIYDDGLRPCSKTWVTERRKRSCRAKLSNICWGISRLRSPLYRVRVITLGLIISGTILIYASRWLMRFSLAPVACDTSAVRLTYLL